MNVIEAVMHMSLYAKAPHPVLVVDGVPLELWLKEADCSAVFGEDTVGGLVPAQGDRKSTRLNSSHLVISYAVFCLKKKKITLSIPLIVSSVPTRYRSFECNVTTMMFH